MSEQYSNWSNRATFLVNTWMDYQDKEFWQGKARSLSEKAFVAFAQDYYKEQVCESDLSGCLWDLMEDQLDRVDWRMLARRWGKMPESD